MNKDARNAADADKTLDPATSDWRTTPLSNLPSWDDDPLEGSPESSPEICCGSPSGEKGLAFESSNGDVREQAQAQVQSWDHGDPTREQRLKQRLIAPPEAPSLGYLPDRPVAADTRPQPDGWACMPCLNGPCKHFTGIAQVTGVIEDIEHRIEFRYCRLLREDAWTMYLGDHTIRYCTSYEPPFFSAGGWMQKIKSAVLQVRASERHNWIPSLKLRVYAAIGSRLGWLPPKGIEALGQQEDE